MSQAKATAIHRSEVISGVMMGTSPAQMASNAALRHRMYLCPGIEHFSINHNEITQNILPGLEIEVDEEAKAFEETLSPSYGAAMSFDGITINRKSIKLVSYSLATYDRVLKLVYADAEDAGNVENEEKMLVLVAKREIAANGRPIFLINTDNKDAREASSVARQLSLVQQQLAIASGKTPVEASAMNSLPGRDAAHTFDLLAKDFVAIFEGCSALKGLLKSIKEFTTFAGTDNIAGFRARELSKDVDLAEVTGELATIPGDMRQSYWGVVLSGKDGKGGVLGNEKVFKRLVESEQFQAWSAALMTSSKKSRVAKMVRCVESVQWWRQVELLELVLSPLQRCVALVSDTQTPMSALLPLACAVNEEIKVALDDTDFRDEFGDDVAESMLRRLEVRINLDGEAPADQRESGQRGPPPRALLDKLALWAYAIDPKAQKLRHDCLPPFVIRFHRPSPPPSHCHAVWAPRGLLSDAGSAAQCYSAMLPVPTSTLHHAG